MSQRSDPLTIVNLGLHGVLFEYLRRWIPTGLSFLAALIALVGTGWIAKALWGF